MASSRTSRTLRRIKNAPASLTIRRAQVVMPCELCELGMGIKWRCVQCQKYMCENCHEIHLTTQHEMVDIASSGATGEIRREKLEELKNFQKSIHNDVLFCKTESEENKQRADRCRSKYNDSIRRITEKEEEVKLAVEKYSLKLCQDVEAESEILMDKTDENEQHIQDVKEKLEDKINKLQAAIESEQTDSIFTVESEIEESSTELSFMQMQKKIKDFIPGETTPVNIAGLFGSLIETEIPNEQTEINFKIMKSHSTHLDHINKIVTIDEKTAWFSNLAEAKLRKVNIDTKIRALKDIPVKIFDMALAPNSKIYLSIRESCDVKLLTELNEIHQFISVDPYFPCAIHVSKENDIILGVTDKGHRYTLSRKRSRKIIVFGIDGKEKQSYEYDKNKEKLFTFPYRITTNIKNNDILVIDRTDNYEGRVMALSSRGQDKWKYQGNPQINSSYIPFDPEAIVTTSLGHIIVADCSNHTLHILSSNGTLILGVADDYGISWPISLDIDTMEQLWIGCIDSQQPPQVNILLAKLTCK
jgi:hypothetical protein